ncbi:MAG: cation:dicarboxylase symporter family transporter [Peptococcaceae bacterium MAG4]|jgi:Na+/H+-dicarboxylate symporter|nr:cation:dicarboxylase symporter family transporter [Peptococcaceae bacterium MAG4]NLW38923.1 dicarboxylate/amino acid:cation symporter [Peptococcaceae bacterium]HQD76568.1 cation:dicarboxylase symporter family transporter [Bacillota bacterium]
MAERRSFKLETASIDAATSFVRNLLKQYKCSSRDIIQAELFTEETIVYWAKAAAQNETFQIELRKRFKTITLSLAYRGAQANPLDLPEEAEDEEFSFIGQNILIGLSAVTYYYENGTNVATFTLKKKGLNPVVAIALAFGAAIICGLTVNRLAPSMQTILPASVLTPLSNAFFGLLNAIVIPFLFVSVIASIFNMDNIAQMKRIFKILFSWFLGLTVISGAIAVLAGMIYFPIQGVSAASASEGVWNQIAAMAFDIVPTNIFKSFLDGNTLQTIFLAIITGVAMLTMKGRFPVLTKAITELNLVLSTLLDAVCSLMPWVIFICIFNMLLSGDSRALLSSLGVVVIICVCFVVFALLCLLSVAVIEKKNPVDYIRTIGSVLLIALSTASSSATFASHTKTATTKQGIRDYLVNFSVPVGALFSKPFVVPVLFLMSLFVGNFYGISFGMADILSMALLCMIMSVAVPPTQGMGTFLFTVVFKKTGIPLEGLAMAASLFILFDYLMTTGNVLSINISMLHTEHFLGKASQREMARFSASA